MRASVIALSFLFLSQLSMPPALASDPIPNRFPDPVVWMEEVHVQSTRPDFRDRIADYIGRANFDASQHAEKTAIIAMLTHVLPPGAVVVRSAYLLKGPSDSERLTFVLICLLKSDSFAYLAFEATRLAAADWYVSKIGFHNGWSGILNGKILTHGDR